MLRKRKRAGRTMQLEANNRGGEDGGKTKRAGNIGSATPRGGEGKKKTGVPDLLTPSSKKRNQ